ncbi:MAG: 50S ribosomal protein L23 [Candidatus Pacebacteria bacterium RIFOXYB1_FULL_39_46]|nr:MAG: 50S ribosomal protein L23 [Candidatus Pacebacteria bacterium RIFOXYB1_FULL_39_46]OGJ39005.1 MAG: 50S ribosomal protein L23 [Candidatus Pacebacteria bacterium RIFOXYA1_FULL_38_18]OGJ39976.1 MAG: 50S ribosomal protein L23 [Candidatus Pacebacteria bacterium RIFOXYD1_FULL_39_27]OGJ40762.1 MAG: 50S ribosomal protein L23 [Candidatus Pacebacteria bacterium RIFOXYC1_FULL_39_21]
MNLQIIRKPVVTEKTLQRANSENVYTFEVDTSADKNIIKAAIEAIYDVKVVAINVIMRPKKAQRTGKKRLKNLSAKTKKALIKLENNQTIDVFDLGGKE